MITPEERDPEPPPPVESAPPPLPPGPVSVAILLPLSGESAEIGTALLDAAQLALFEIGNPELVLLPRDTGGTSEGAVSAAKAALDDGAELILGPWFGSSAAAIAPLSRARGINVVTFSSDRTVAGAGVFVMGFLPTQQVARVVTFATEGGFTRFAAIAPDSRYGNLMITAFRDVCGAIATPVSRVSLYPEIAVASSDASDVIREFADYEERQKTLEEQRQILAERDDEISREALRRLAGRDTLGDVDYDAVLIADSGPRLRAVAPLLPYFDVDPAKVKMLGPAQWETTPLGDEPALVGGWFAAPPREGRERFVTRFEDLFGYPPPRLATLAYDSVALAGALALRPEGPDFSAEALTTATGFNGIDGLFRFKPDGGNERGLGVYEVTPDGPKLVSPAPKSFAIY